MSNAWERFRREEPENYDHWIRGASFGCLLGALACAGTFGVGVVLGALLW